MTAKRKLWKTRQTDSGAEKRHTSEVAAYRYLREQAAAVETPGVVFAVYVDERTGQGWLLFERIGLDEIRPNLGGGAR